MSRDLKGKVCWFDTETTGLSATRNDIIQLAMLIEIDGNIKAKYNWVMQPTSYKDISKEALKINGVTIADLKKYPDSKTVYQEILMVLDSYIDKYDRNDKFTPAGQNVAFDVDFLLNFFKKNKNKYYGSYFNWRALDTLAIARFHTHLLGVQLDSYKLEDLVKYYEVDLSDDDFHDAMVDVIATRKLFYKISELTVAFEPKS